MRLSFFSLLVVVGTGPLVLAGPIASPVPQESAPTSEVKPLALDAFMETAAMALNPEQLADRIAEATAISANITIPEDDGDEDASFDTFAVGPQCNAPRIRREWHSLPAANKTEVVEAILCLMSKPASGKYPQSDNRYEDLVALHQAYTANIHGNSKFLLWHRYFTYILERELQTQCGMQTNWPWFDETKWAGRFKQSDIFSDNYFGEIETDGSSCVLRGKFANLALNIGPGTTNRFHCLQRHGDGALTSRITPGMVDNCNNEPTFVKMSTCSEGSAHAYGHNGIGGVMMDVYASVGDPVFFLHHGFVDHSYRLWQNRDQSRVTQAGLVGAYDVAKKPVNMNTQIFMNGVAGYPDVYVRDIIDTTGPLLCYRYDY